MQHHRLSSSIAVLLAFVFLSACREKEGAPKNEVRHLIWELHQAVERMT